jgi:hypothetical protein
MKVIVTIPVTLLLNILCEQGLSFVSWIIVFIPFIFMTVIVSILLYIFGLDTTTGTLNYKGDRTTSKTSTQNNITIDDSGNIVIYDPEYNSTANSVYYRSPYIIVPNPTANDRQIKKNYKVIQTYSSDYAYQS